MERTKKEVVLFDKGKSLFILLLPSRERREEEDPKPN